MDLSFGHNSSLNPGSVNSHHSKGLQSNAGGRIREIMFVVQMFCIISLTGVSESVPWFNFFLELNISPLQLLKSDGLRLLRERRCNGSLN